MKSPAFTPFTDILGPRACGRIGRWLLVLLLLWAATDGRFAFAALPGVHISQVDCNTASTCYTYLGGNYLEVGIGPNGSHGSAGLTGGATGATLATINANKTSGSDFFGRQTPTGQPLNDGIGLLGDADGLGDGADLRIDYFLPGTPREGWGIFVGTTSAGNNWHNTNNIPVNSILNSSSGNTLSWTGTHTTNITGVSGIQVTQRVSFDVNSQQVTYTVTLKNTTGSQIDDILYYRYVDPDNVRDVDNLTYNTLNTIVSQGDGTASSVAVVTAQSATSGTYYSLAGNQVATTGYASADLRAKVYHNLPSLPTRLNFDSPPTTGENNGTVDSKIGIAFTVSSLAAGAETSFVYKAALGESPTVAPTLQSTTPEDNATNVATGSTIALTFDVAVAVAATAKSIRIVNDTDSSTETIDVSSHGGKLALSNGDKTLTITPGTALVADKSYHIEIDSGAIVDASNNSLVYPGIADSTTLNFSTVAKTDQTITFTPPASGTVGGSATLSASASSGLPVTFSSQTASICTISGSAVNYAAAGTCTVRASQGGDANYNAAPDVDRNIAVGKADQTITFNPPASGTVGGNAALSATASSGLPVTFSSQTASVCTVSGSTVNYLTAGTCAVHASQAGNANYNAAPDVDRNITVGGASSSVALASSINPSTFSQNVTFTATVTGQNPTGAVDFSADGNPISGCASVALAGSGNSKTAACSTAALSGGTHPIIATYDGDANNQAGNDTLQQVVQNVFTGPSANGQGNITAAFNGGGAGCGLTQASFVNASAALPTGYTFPYGLLRFTLGGACDGSAVNVQVTYPTTLPAGAKYWKYGKTQNDPTSHWYELLATITGNTVTFSLTDGGLGDDDLTANGSITDDGGAGVPASNPTDIPTLSEWAMLLLIGLLGLFGIRRLRQEA